MSYLKSLTSKDVIVTPFTVHKQFSYNGNPLYYNGGSTFWSIGTNTTYPEAGGSVGTGSFSLTYNSIKQLYYSNFLQIGDNGITSDVSTASFNPDGTITGPRYTPNYINNIQSIDEYRYFPTESYFSPAATTGKIFYLSIPTKLFGHSIKPGSYSDDNMSDDGQGNLMQDGQNVGNIIYEAGLVIETGNTATGEGSGAINGFENPSWESTITIYETQYKCTIRANEFNYSLNPSLIIDYGQDNIINSGSSTYKGFVTGSDFSPYITTVGLYDDEQNLLAVGKLAQPLQTSQTTDTTILINIDR